jgi:hypothetical protein
MKEGCTMNATQTMSISKALTASKYNAIEKEIKGVQVVVTQTDTGIWLVAEVPTGHVYDDEETRYVPTGLARIAYRYGGNGWTPIN